LFVRLVLPRNLALLVSKEPVASRKYVLREIAQRLRPDLEAAVKRSDAPLGEEFSAEFKQYARRTLKNRALALLGELGDPAITADLLERQRGASNMTDKVAALAALLEQPGKDVT
jgi:aminopeptidase N